MDRAPSDPAAPHGLRRSVATVWLVGRVHHRAASATTAEARTGEAKANLVGSQIERSSPPAFASSTSVPHSPVRQRLRWIPPGRFLMGSPKDEPGRWDWEQEPHEVTIAEGFWMFDTPCTQALWETVMGDNPSRFRSPDRPVEQVSWNDCQEFVKRINATLTEKAGKGTPCNSSCRPKRNGNTPVGRAQTRQRMQGRWRSRDEQRTDPPRDCLVRREQRARFRSGQRRSCFRLAREAIRLRRRLARTLSGGNGRMPGGCMICWGMSGSGARVPAVEAEEAEGVRPPRAPGRLVEQRGAGRPCGMPHLYEPPYRDRDLGVRFCEFREPSVVSQAGEAERAARARPGGGRRGARSEPPSPEPERSASARWRKRKCWKAPS